MIEVGTVRRYPGVDTRGSVAALGVVLLVLVGYFGVSDLRIAAVLTGAVALGAWAAVAVRWPHVTLPCSFALLLVAGTKFRVRDATATLDGAADVQTLMELGLFALVGAGALAAWLAAGDRRRVTVAEGSIAAYVTIAVLSILWSAAPALTLVRAAQLLVVAALAIAAVRILSPGRALWTAIVAVVFHVLLFSAIAIVVPAARGVAETDGLQRFGWFAVHPIDVGTLAAIGALGMMAVALHQPPGRSARLCGIPAWLLAVPLVTILLLASTRGALIAFTGAAGLLMLLRLHGAVRWPLALTAGAAVLLLAAFGPNVEARLNAVASDYPLADRLFFRGQGAGTVLELNGRLELWEDLRPVIAERIVAGHGYQASRAVLLDTASWAAYAHNALLQTLLDLGVFGTLALLAVIAIALAGMTRGDLGPWLRAAVAALAAFVVVNSISTESFAAAPGFDALVLFLCALCAGSPRAAPGQRAS